MKKVGIITFHAAHNYGSMLQAYALQQTVLGLGYECEIINLRTKIQRKNYRPYFMHIGWIKHLKALGPLRLIIESIQKYRKFEKFINEKYILSKHTYTTAKELRNANLDYDCYISGSDQIWNTSCFDFQTSYFLDFVKHGKRIAYAPSMGPKPFDEIDKKFYPFIKESVAHYDAIAVREQDEATLLKQVANITPSVVLDPTLLVNPKDWSALAGDKPLINSDYIFIYTPWYNKYEPFFTAALKLAKRLNLKVICSLSDNVYQWRNEQYILFYTAVGPIEFLNLVKYSKYVFCGSFHAVVFSILLNKPFFAYKGMNDSRIAPLLKTTGLERCTEIQEGQLPISYNYEETIEKLELPIKQSIQYLKSTIYD